MILAQFFGSVLGMLAVIFGAFGAHALKGKFSEEQLQSFETGVKYQMYHAIVLLAIGFTAPQTWLFTVVTWLFFLGVLLFSFSIYLLCYTGYKGNKWKFLGPVTPLGGLLLVVAWGMIAYGAFSLLLI
ncbi:Uncharacterized membrane protein YgdD, TMEM256/DUF423 family [Pustulibacterium marinum]|uniref:Uncharacterized membrane protein YgdD, TMEM256/DUF423 family n=1 Tax=Pustulibacterium marinum TaxID=1224947 RepID=A0A1I7I6H5_9FLAO|nr:DUF423 domain-containing protein [Pustulibacterium marinum]SFU68549.1 Uncharacterized membrane protein YgdD, TMEM256/DUF423 family [Pustulibacterium marinum]